MITAEMIFAALQKMDVFAEDRTAKRNGPAVDPFTSTLIDDYLDLNELARLLTEEADSQHDRPGGDE